MSRCSACNSPLRDGARFCGQCGAANASVADTSPRCQQCGGSLRAGSRFCGACGTAAASHAARASRAASAHDGVVFVANRRSRSALDWLSGDVLWVDADGAIEAVQKHLADRDLSAVTDVCLIGDDESIPFCRLDDPCGYDETLLTDVVYGMTRSPSFEERMAGDVIPEVPVTRIPTTATDTVSRLLATDQELATDWSGGVCVSASVWQHATRAVMERIASDVEVRESPPVQRAGVGDHLQRRPGRMLFNVHGTDQDSVWLGEGQGRYPEILRPSDVAARRGAVVVSEACYGATLVDRSGSIAPTFLTRGAGLFVGSTIIAWGAGPGAPPTLADELARDVYLALDQGLFGSHALHHARIALVERALATGAGLSAPLHNTSLSFVSYGGPATTSRPPRARPRATARTAAGELRRARERLRQRISPSSWRVLSSGRTTLADLSRRYRAGSSVWKTLQGLLEDEPREAKLIAYGAAQEDGATLLAESRSPTGHLVRAGVDIDSAGRVQRSYVTR